MADDEKGLVFGRWWEDYFVRYFVGTVIGTAVLLFVAHRLASHLPVAQREFIEALIFSPTKVDAKILIGVAASGLAYCYVASAPMMILHATRAQLFRSENRAEFGSHFWILLTVMLAIVVPVEALALFPISGFGPYLGYLPLLLTLIPQMLLIAIAHGRGLETVRTFYADLGVARSRELAGSGYVDSYKHLREHSNAYAIIALEFVFAFVLLSVPSRPVHWAVAIVLWVLPAAYCWFIGTFLEAVFTYVR